MARYHFVTDLEVTAGREEVWAALRDPTTWPSWWRWLRAVTTLEEGEATGAGARHRLAFGTALPYTLTFETRVVRAVPPAVLESRARGELAGSGLWQLTETERGAAARYTWIVETTKRWMNVLAPVARPVFAWNHDVLMRDFARGLAGTLEATLVSVTNRTVPPTSAEFGRLPGAGPAS